MNHRQKLVQERFLNNEEAVIRRLKQVYSVAQKDIEKKAQAFQDDINRLDEMANLAVDEKEKARLLSMKQSKIYQKQYQDAMKTQIGSVLDNMQVEEFKTVSDYLQKCYEDGFVGTMFDLQGQGIPLCFPMDQEAMVRAVQLDSKISQGLYSRLGEDVALLKKKITAQVSRGIASGMSWQQVAQQLAGYTKIGYNNAIRIARTEGHRIQVQGAMDACFKAKDKGADVVKQWDSTLDDSTRESHQAVDGEIRELEKPFSNGLMFPGDPSGRAAEVINCRCALLQRARWALDDSFTKMDNFSKQLETFESPKAYDEFKKGFFSDENVRYMDYVRKMEEKYGTQDFRKVLDMMDDQEYKKYSKLLNSNPVFNKNAKNDKIVQAGKIEANGLFVNKTEALFRYAKNIPPIDGYEDFTCHADPDNFLIDMIGNGKDEDFFVMSPEEYAEAIKNSQTYKGGNVRIISCQAGAKPNGSAQRLANALGVDVYAPTEIVNIAENGEMFISDNDILADLWYNAPDRSAIKETGKWIVFHPKKG